MKRTICFVLCLLAVLAAFGAPAEPTGEIILPETGIDSCFPARDAGMITPQSFDDPTPTGELEIWFGRISCCDGFIVRCGGETMMIDGGSKGPRLATYALLDGLGIHDFDYLFNTHHHDDHLQMQTFMVGKGTLRADTFLTPYERGYNVQAQREAEAAMDAAGIEYRVIRDGDSMRLGGENGALLQFYRWTGNTNANYSSVMCKITYGNRSVFLMADVIGVAQEGLLEREDIDWKADILKAGHHGYTEQNGELLDRMDPEICIITNSPKGGQKTGAQMKRLGIPYYYTNHGTLYLHTDGGDHWFLYQDKSYLK